MSKAEMKRVITLLEEAKRLALARNESQIAELIERARRAALDRLYPAAAPLVSVRRKRSDGRADD